MKSEITGQEFARGATFCVARTIIGGPASLSKALALPAGSRRVAACAACAFATAPTTRPRTVASCVRRRARACSGPFPLWRGIVPRALQCAALGGGQGVNMCDKCATRKVYSVFSTVFCLSCCLLLV